LQDPSARLEARPLGLRTPGAWLPSLGAGPATPAGRATGCSHLALGLPALGAWAAYLCAGQTKRTCGAWVTASVLVDQPHTWRLG